MATAIIGLEIAEAIIEAGIVITTGLLAIGSCYVIAKKGEKVKDIEAAVSSTPESKKCCCGLIGPSGAPYIHFVMKKSRKEAMEAALHYHNANGVELHPHNTKDKYPHYHPTRNGKKIPGIHIQFPKL
ncbi:hypothetical protein BCR32DRAFT_277361 [Anaeromyces robustus]|uniref:Uncharacterized protein n=1 Tax=Anaeromyces robustus TaxID=1754192 RepID=A0A1Y1XEN4_9FUNG|nr:hypothetical protein BCR32DRAFT_277361 [Anaeromyces robustus]|eukprot:ORX84183.1 hypothetical protein BCR32DRAFT_277361 [Anaeromyces robustus]